MIYPPSASATAHTTQFCPFPATTMEDRKRGVVPKDKRQSSFGWAKVVRWASRGYKLAVIGLWLAFACLIVNSARESYQALERNRAEVQALAVAE